MKLKATVKYSLYFRTAKTITGKKINDMQMTMCSMYFLLQKCSVFGRGTHSSLVHAVYPIRMLLNFYEFDY